jgi:ABC-type antimicrobial peptide transport system permease subunit
MATVRAVGSASGQIIRQVMLEAVLVGAAGAVLGIVAGLSDQPVRLFRSWE